MLIAATFAVMESFVKWDGNIILLNSLPTLESRVTKKFNIQKVV